MVAVAVAFTVAVAVAVAVADGVAAWGAAELIRLAVTLALDSLAWCGERKEGMRCRQSQS